MVNITDHIIEQEVSSVINNNDPIKNESCVKQTNPIIENIKTHKKESTSIKDKRYNLMMTEIEVSDFDFSKVLVLDTGATFHSVKDRSLFTGIYKSDQQLKMYTSTGERILANRGSLFNHYSGCGVTHGWRRTHSQI